MWKCGNVEDRKKEWVCRLREKYEETLDHLLHHRKCSVRVTRKKKVDAGDSSKKKWFKEIVCIYGDFLLIASY